MAEQLEYPNLELELSDLGNLVKQQMQQTLFSNNSVKTGNLARSIRPEVVVDVKGNIALPISFYQYGEWVDTGHRTRLGDSRRSGYRPKPGAKAQTTPKPWIQVSMLDVVNEKLQDIANATALDIADNIQTNYGTIPLK